MAESALCTNGLLAFVKRACPTCTLIEPQLQAVARAVPGFRAVSQDDPQFPADVDVVDDRELKVSSSNDIEITPTLVRYRDGREVERVVGWDRDGWRRLSGLAALGADLPAFRPG